MSDINTVTMNVSLPEPLKQFVDSKVASGLYSSASELVREAIREKLGRDEELQQARAKFTDLLLEGVRGGPALPMPDDYADQKKRAFLGQQQPKAAE